MSLLNIPMSYIPTSEEMNDLSLLVEQAEDDCASDHNYRIRLRELQRKLCLLDSVFRASETDQITTLIESVRGELVRRGPPDENSKPHDLGRPPYPTDENGSFEVAGYKGD